MPSHIALPRCIVRPAAGADRSALRLFCFPHAGGHAGMYREWPRYAPSSLEVCGIELPGRGTRFSETATASLDGIVRDVAASIASLADKPFALFGHSMGAMLAYETACALARGYRTTPSWLFVSGWHPPHVELHRPKMSDLPDQEFVEALVQLNGTPPEVVNKSELLSLLLPMLRSDVTLCENYVYEDRPALPCAITVFAGTHDPETPLDSLHGWHAYTRAAMRLCLIDGDHFFVRSAAAQVVGHIWNDLNLLSSSPA
jgi:surfactin synthase thioesterase subunit